MQALSGVCGGGEVRLAYEGSKRTHLSGDMDPVANGDKRPWPCEGRGGDGVGVVTLWSGLQQQNKPGGRHGAEAP